MGNRAANKLLGAQRGHNLKSVLRYWHLKNLALWFSGEDTPIQSLSTLFGRRLTADGEASGIPNDPDRISCQRCETILKPGFSCNIRIEKLSAKKKHIRCKNSNICLPQNNVVYSCNFCSHHNLKRGTAKSINPSKPKIKKKMMPQIQSKMFSSPERIEKDQVENMIST